MGEFGLGEGGFQFALITLLQTEHITNFMHAPANRIIQNCSVSWDWYIPNMDMQLHQSRQEHVIERVEQDVESTVLLYCV